VTIQIFGARSRIVALSLALVATAGVVAVARWTTWSARGGAAIGVYGLEAPLSLAELSQRADLVVIGTVASDVVRPFTANPDVPISDRDPKIYAKGAYHDVRLNVIEYLKGRGPQQLSIRSFASSGSLGLIASEAPTLIPGQQYALFLQRGESVWSGGYLVLGSRGVGQVTGSTVDFRASFGRMDIAMLRTAVAPR